METRCVATAADSRYFPALIALLRSLARTNPQVPLVVFENGLTKRQKRKAGAFAELISREPCLKIKGTGKFSYIGDSTLLKLDAVTLSFDKVLFLDADMVVLDKLDELFDVPCGMVGAVPEVNVVKNMFRVQHRKMLREKIDIDWDSPGFNAGLFSLRPAEWAGLGKKVKALVSEFGEDVFSKTKDQQLLNILFSGKIKPFHRRYNFSPFYDKAEGYKPAVVHYLSGCKPWHFEYPEGHYYREFRSSLSVADCPGIVLQDIWRKIRK